VRMIYRDGATLAVDFSEIERMRYCDSQSRRARTFWQKLIDPFGRLMQHDRLRFRDWFREVVLNVLPPYSFGFGSGKAEVHLRLYAGYRGMRFLLPWWNTPFKSKDLNLVPNDAREFYQQLVFAFNKWKKKKA